MQKQDKGIEPFRLKQVIMVAFFFMMVGTVVELYLIEHYEGLQQMIPLLCIGTSLLLVIVLFFRISRFAISVFKLTMGITALSGVYGTFLHLRANYEFEQEMQPTADKTDLLLESLSGALPTLAPCSLIVLALLGYSYVLLLKQKK